MEQDYIEIDLLKYIPLDSYVTLDPEFRKDLFKEAIKKVGNRSKLAKLIGTNITSLWEWGIGRESRRISLNKIFKCAEIIGISKNELRSNIVGITSFYRAGVIFVKDWKLSLDEEFAEWLGLLEGDGTVSEKYVDCGNTFFELVFFFAYGLQKWFGINKEQIEFEIRVPFDSSIKDAKLIEQLLKLRGFTRIKIRRIEESKKRKQFLLCTRSNLKVLASILKYMLKDLPLFLKKSSNKVKAVYIGGFASAEGSITKDKNSRRLSISQKDSRKLLFIKDLLTDLKFKHFTDPRPTGNVFRICLSRRRELERYIKEIGFGQHEIRNQKMREILSTYSQAEHKQRTERFNEVLEFIKQNKKVTGSLIAKKLGVVYKYANQILNDMLKTNLIKANNSSRPFIYFLGGKSD